MHTDNHFQSESKIIPYKFPFTFPSISPKYILEFVANIDNKF